MSSDLEKHTICSRHFKSTDFLMGEMRRSQLLPTAIPTEHLDATSPVKDPPIDVRIACNMSLQGSLKGNIKFMVQGGRDIIVWFCRYPNSWKWGTVGNHVSAFDRGRPQRNPLWFFYLCRYSRYFISKNFGDHLFMFFLFSRRKVSKWLWSPSLRATRRFECYQFQSPNSFLYQSSTWGA